MAPDQHGDAIDHGFAEVFGWLAVREGVSVAGAPLIRYIEVDMTDSLVIALAVPVEGTPPPDERVRAGVLPAGDHVTLLFRGHYDGLVAANAEVQQWASSTACVGRWTARLRGARGSSNISPTRAKNRTRPSGKPRSHISSRSSGEVVARLVRHGEDLRIGKPII